MSDVQLHYTDIGHNHDDDVLWIMLLGGFQAITALAGESRVPHTHSEAWGITADDNWRGRFEPSTGFCSIATPYGKDYATPPTALLQLLQEHFPVVRFYVFSGPNVRSMSPNPRRRR